MKSLLVKIIIISLIWVFYTPTFAQTFAVQAGFNLAKSDFTSKLEEGSLTTAYEKMWKENESFNPGFHVGVLADFELAKFLSLQSGLLFTTKGFDVFFDEGGTIDYAEEDLYYLDLPISVTGNIPLADDLDLRLSAGPTVGVALFGKRFSKYEYVVEGVTYSESFESDISFGPDYDTPRFDYGLNYGAGLRYQAMEIGATFDHGLAKVWDDEYYTLQNRVWRMHVRYWFNRKG